MKEQAKVTMIEPTDSRWMDLIQSCPEANIFQSLLVLVRMQ